MARFFSTYDSWRLDSGREGDDEPTRLEVCSFHKCELTPDGRCEGCDDLDSALDREFGR